MNVSRKTVIVLIILSFFFSPSLFAQKDKVQDNVDIVFHNTARMLQGIHFAPKEWNDSFSRKIYNTYMDELDPGKRFFTQTDITSLNSYEDQLDDELKGAPVSFYKSANELYKQRLTDARKLITELLNKSFSFSGNETYDPKKEKLNFPANDQEKKQRWDNYLKYQVLNQYEELLQQRTKDSTLTTDDHLLQAKARANVLKVEMRILDNLQKLTTNEEAFNIYLNDIVNLYDPHSNYFLPIDRREFQEDMTGIYYGIGALLKEEMGKVTIGELMIGGPAWKSRQVDQGDVIIKVKQNAADSTVNVEGWAMSDVIKLTRGTKGSFVTISFRKKDGTVKDISLQRDALQLEDSFVKSAVIEDSEKIGYIYFPKFYTSFGDANGRSCAADMAKELQKLKKENVKGIIVDIRNNGGGSLGEVINMVGLFMKEGPVVQVKSSNEKPEVNGVKNAGVVYDGPLVVLVNEMSASASEIFAGAIQDYKRGIIMGAPTYGKGTVQRSFPVPLNFRHWPDSTIDLGTLHVTLQKYYRITGEATQLKGILPDVNLPGIYESYDMQEKDQPSALPWDKIASANFQQSTEAPVIQKLVADYKNKITQDTLLQSLQKNLHWLASKSDSWSLNLEKFKQQKKQLRDITSTIRKEFVTTKTLAVKNNTEMEDVIQKQEKFRQDNNKAWLNNLKNDLYLSRAVSLMRNYIQMRTI
ncbi:MAG: hypothetical protein JWN76_833 [Chitinophagaceae bacterium]|nr:hypothetical protein [Chitinophagaceae bacterium]